MQYTVKTGDPAQQRTACLALGVFAQRKLSDQARRVDEASGGFLTGVIKRGDIVGNTGQTLMLYDVPGLRAQRVLLVGCGKRKELTAAQYRRIVAAAAPVLNRSHAKDALWCLTDDVPQGATPYSMARDTVLAAEDALYRFDHCKSDADAPKRPLERLDLLLADAGAKVRQKARKGLDHGAAIASGVRVAKDLGNLPGNICTPTYLAERALKEGSESPKLKVSVLEEKDMEKLGMGALLSVARGSRQPAKLIVMEYSGGKSGQKPVVLVGKGLTFDAGGISIKPAADMDQMKFDMCGGASVIGTLRACADLELPINVVGLVPSSENLPDGAANKPGDIVTSMSGQTIEILNTDAEGRLILCDTLTYSERFEPAAVIDIATLTGACVIALGHFATGVLANDDRLADEVISAGEHTGDRAWRLPLWDEYQKSLDSNFADMANIGGRSAGAVTAACFLSRYTKKLKWAHLDIAGTAWKTGDAKGATGRPVPLLTQLLVHRCGLGD
ncbi:MAG: leucyl aminopeptidase [Chromatiales bacterium]|jgi:leucyl aminopeptidase